MKRRKPGRTADYSELAGAVQKNAGFRGLVKALEETGLSADTLVAWGLERNDFIHNVAHGSPRGAPAVSAAPFATRGAMIATTGLRLARIVCAWSKQELSGRASAGKSVRTICKLSVTAPRGIDQAHCVVRPEFADSDIRDRLNPCDLVDMYNGVYDSHGIGVPRKGGVLHVRTDDKEISIRLDDPRIGIAFYEDRTRAESKSKMLYARSVWEDWEWQMSELVDSKLEMFGLFDIRKLSLGIRLIPDMKGGTEKLVSHILYGGFVMHAPFGHNLGRGTKSKFWMREKGHWTPLRNPRPHKGSEDNVAASFFG